jgi:hypothetical protein
MNEGRDDTGKFTRGNRIAKGNPHAQKVAKLRSALLRAVTTADLKEVIQALVWKAKEGDVQAIRELLNRTLGPAEAIDLLLRVEKLEGVLGNENQNSES